MQIAEEALKVLRESQTTSEENRYMHAYSFMVVEVNKMREELNTKAGVISNEVFNSKSKRVEDLEECLILFNECYFKMMYYKQEMITNKSKLLSKEFEFVNFVTKHIDNE
tara:strand:- start:19 stop:348 length:330 start_codon:yes stop_codon:yes gene_type:complete